MATSSSNIDLFNRLLQGKLSSDETEELISVLASEQPDPKIEALLQQHLQQYTERRVTPEITTALEARLPGILSKAPPQPASRIPFFKKVWVRYSSAAALIILLAGSARLWTYKSAPVKPLSQSTTVAAVNNPIVPGRQGAILTLDDGRTIVLDSLKNGVIATQNGSKVLLDNGRLAYNKILPTGEITYNTMTTPKGRQFQLQLPDGTKLWLDAASSIRYPTAFTGNSREVQVTGEAYFEVAKNPSMPFIVKIRDRPVEIEVLGTHFNINAYNNEASINTTLLEGSVKINNSNELAVLKPGQQAQASASDTKAGIKILTNVDVHKVMAWKDGVFDFEDATLEQVMRQLERWYDIEVIYERGVPPLEFVGKMGRDLSLSDVLRGLEVSEVHFSIQGRKLVVKP